MRIPLLLLPALVTIAIGVGNGCSSASKDGTGGAGGGAGGAGGSVGVGGAGSGGHTGSGGNTDVDSSTDVDGHTGVGGSPASDAAAVDAGGMTCSPACAAGSVCVGTGTEGGPIIFADAGVCPAGSHPSGIGSYCNLDLSYACMTIPAACGGGTPTCACASTLCPPSHICRPQTDGALQCVQQNA
jgi:hypothetical protein